MKARPKSDSRSELRAAQRRYLAIVQKLDPQQRTLTEIARAGGINPSTLTRFVNNPRHEGTLDALTIRRVAEVTGIAPGAELSDGGQVGMLEDAEPYIAGPGDAAGAIARAVSGGRIGVEPWILRTRALAGAGYMPGDVVILDLNATARAGDAVCAQVYELSRMRAQTLWRLYEPPYLVAAATDPELRKPLLVDGDRVAIKGVVIAALRLRSDRP